MFWLNDSLLAWGLYLQFGTCWTAEAFQHPPFLGSIAGASQSSGSPRALAPCWPQVQQPECLRYLGYSLHSVCQPWTQSIPRGLWIRVSLFYIGVISFLVPQILGHAKIFTCFSPLLWLPVLLNYDEVQQEILRKFCCAGPAARSPPGAVAGSLAARPEQQQAAGSPCSILEGKLKKEYLILLSLGGFITPIHYFKNSIADLFQATITALMEKSSLSESMEEGSATELLWMSGGVPQYMATCGL